MLENGCLVLVKMLRMRFTMLREVTLLRMSKLVGKLELSFSIGHMKVKSCLAKATRPHFYDVLNVHVEEGLLTVTEGDHV